MVKNLFSMWNYSKKLTLFIAELSDKMKGVTHREEPEENGHQLYFLFRFM